MYPGVGKFLRRQERAARKGRERTEQRRSGQIRSESDGGSAGDFRGDCEVCGLEKNAADLVARDVPLSMRTLGAVCPDCDLVLERRKRWSWLIALPVGLLCLLGWLFLMSKLA